MTQSQITFAPDVADLVRDAQAGDVAARDELIAGHLSLVYNIVGRALYGHPDVDDLVQDTMLRAIRGLPALRDPARFRSWLVAIAYRQVQQHLRVRTTNRLRRHPEPVDVPDPGGDFAERTTAELVVAEQRRDIARAADWLDSDDRRLLALWWQEAAGALSRAELADALAVQPKHAAVRVQRMKAQLDSARAIVRALRVRPRCPELAGQLRRWDGVADPLWRKRLIRHVRDCPRCAAFQTGLVAPEKLLLGVAALPVPAAVLTGVKAGLKVKAGTPVLAHLSGLLHHKVLAAAAAVGVAASGGLAYAVYWSPAPPGDGLAITRPTAAVRPITPAPPVRGSAGTPAPSATPASHPATGTGVQSADIYVAPGGSDSGDGSLKRPYASLGRAVSVVQPGQTIALRGGTYRPTQPIGISTSGTAAKRIVLSNYRGERPVIDASGIPADHWAITQQAAYWTVQGLEVAHSKSHAYVCRGCRDDVFQRLSMHDNARSGMMLRDPGTVGNKVLDSDFFNNRDPAGAAGVGIGLGVQFGSGDGNLVRGNRAYGNAGDGFEFGFDSPVTVEYNWSFRNGQNGFTFGGGNPPTVAAHTARHDAAWDNGGHGFTDEGNTAAMVLSNDTAFRNRLWGFALPDAVAVLRYDVAIGNGQVAGLNPAGKATNNSWQRGDGTAAMFRSTDPTVAEGPRTAAGTLLPTDFLTTENGQGASMAGT